MTSRNYVVNCPMENIKSLGASMLIQATKDYISAEEDEQQEILKDLRSERCKFLTNGLSKTVAEQLEKNPKEIKKRLKEGLAQCKN